VALLALPAAGWWRLGDNNEMRFGDDADWRMVFDGSDLLLTDGTNTLATFTDQGAYAQLDWSDVITVGKGNSSGYQKLKCYRDQATVDFGCGAASFLKNDNDEWIGYGDFIFAIEDPADGAEDGYLTIGLYLNGSLPAVANRQFKVYSDGDGYFQGDVYANGSTLVGSFDADADSGTAETVASGDTLTLAGGTGIATSVAATDTVTVALSHLGIESLSDPGADRILFWDDVGAGAVTWLVPNQLISISGTNLDVDNDLHNYDWTSVVDADVPDAITVTGYMEDTDVDTFIELQAWVVGNTLVNAEGNFTLSGNWVNTANPWADNEVSDTLTVGAAGSVDDAAIPAGVTRDTEWDTRDEVEAVWAGTTTVWCDDNDGAASTLDADTLDGSEGSAYGKLAAAETIAGNWVNTANPWADNEVADTLTVGAAGSVDDGALSANVAHLNASENVSGTWEWQDDVAQVFGADADFEVEFVSASSALRFTTPDGSWFQLVDHTLPGVGEIPIWKGYSNDAAATFGGYYDTFVVLGESDGNNAGMALLDATYPTDDGIGEIIWDDTANDLTIQTYRTATNPPLQVEPAGDLNLTPGTGNTAVTGDVTVSGDTTLGDASSDTVTCTAAFFPRQVNDAGPMTGTNGTEGEIVYNTADNKFYGCTTTGTPATWAAFH